MNDFESIQFNGDTIIEQFENHTFPQYDTEKIIEFLSMKNAEFLAKASLGLNEKDQKDIVDFYNYFMEKYDEKTLDVRLEQWGREPFIFRLAEEYLGYDDDFEEFDEDDDEDEEMDNPPKYNLWLSDAYYEDDMTCEQPVVLGFSPEEREWAKQERSSEEIAEFVLDYYGGDLADLFDVLLDYNDAGFICVEPEGHIEKSDDSYMFVTKDPDLGSFEISGDEDDLASIYRTTKRHPERLICFVIQYEGKEDGDFLYLFNEDLPIERLEYRAQIELYKRFLEHAGIKTYRALAKALNRAWKAYILEEDEDWS